MPHEELESFIQVKGYVDGLLTLVNVGVWDRSEVHIPKRAVEVAEVPDALAHFFYVENISRG